MYTGDLACERLFYGPAALPEPYLGQFLQNPFENPAMRIQHIEGYRMSINGLGRKYINRHLSEDLKMNVRKKLCIRLVRCVIMLLLAHVGKAPWQSESNLVACWNTRTN
jgi:hypothetical protein